MVLQFSSVGFKGMAWGTIVVQWLQWYDLGDDCSSEAGYVIQGYMAWGWLQFLGLKCMA